jgi:hypothetical protein
MQPSVGRDVVAEVARLALQIPTRKYEGNNHGVSQPFRREERVCGRRKGEGEGGREREGEEGRGRKREGERRREREREGEGEKETRIGRWGMKRRKKNKE